MKKPMSRIRIKLGEILSNSLFQFILICIFSIPLIATLGQYIYSEFIYKDIKVLILFWPGIKNDYAVIMPVWISFGLISICYLIGIGYLYKKKTLGKVVFWGVLGNCLSFLIGFVYKTIFGLAELQQVNFDIPNGVVNKLIFSLWHNSIWEELVFRALPLIILLTLKNKLSERRHKIAIAIYFVIPSIAFSMYHIPNHGMSRIADTFILAIFFAWLALKYSLFAPIVLHCIFDASWVLRLVQIKDIPENEITWLSHFGNSLNTFYELGILFLIITIPVFFIWNERKTKKIKSNAIKIFFISIVIMILLGIILSHFIS